MYQRNWFWNALPVVVPISIAAVLGACGSSDVACGPTENCGPANAELAITQVDIEASARGEDGLAIVQADGMNVSFTVRNNGKISSEAKPLQLRVGPFNEVLVSLPPIASHREFSSVAHIPQPPDGFFLNETDTMSVRAAVVTLDENSANDVLSSPTFHLAIPALRITPFVDSIFLRADAATPGKVTIQNMSQYATLPPSVQAWCIYDLGGRCSREFTATAFGGVAIPALAPGQSITVNNDVVVPSGASHHNLIDFLSLGNCLQPGTRLNTGTINPSLCSQVRDVEVRPDLESCFPVTLIVDVPTAGVPSCREPCDIVAFRVQVEAGHSYRVDLLSGEEDATLRWRTRYRDNPVDLSPDAGLQPAQSGTVYVMTATKFCLDDPGHQVVLHDLKEISGRN